MILVCHFLEFLTYSVITFLLYLWHLILCFMLILNMWKSIITIVSVFAIQASPWFFSILVKLEGM
ncbi:hypothetical protein DVH24_030635 [Malus domestica]|uniref:Uncharacterized protein n=1 Tax=Malus domestica TaxID=3750 RepID=A0A498K2I3_MALDO|nr:hypothetical protein DVH24_030635 [Malus domestica]